MKSAPSTLSNSKILQKKKMSKFGTKNALVSYFWARFLKDYCHILYQHPQICLFAKFHETTKIPKFGTKSPLVWYFWARIFKNGCHI